MNRLEGNKLICKFMGYEIVEDREKYFYIVHPIKTKLEWSNRFQDNIETNKFCSMYEFFDNSWDWLMTVVEKIEELGYFVMINKWTAVYLGSSGTDKIKIQTVEGKSKIENTFKAICDFIIWYNENNI